MVCSNQPTDGGRSPQAGRATLASHQAPAGLGHAEGIPNAALPDRTSAEALRIAHEVIKANGWRRTPREIGQTARRILDGLKEDGDA